MSTYCRHKQNAIKPSFVNGFRTKLDQNCRRPFNKILLATIGRSRPNKICLSNWDVFGMCDWNFICGSMRNILLGKLLLSCRRLELAKRFLYSKENGYWDQQMPISKSKCVHVLVHTWELTTMQWVVLGEQLEGGGHHNFTLHV